MNRMCAVFYNGYYKLLDYNSNLLRHMNQRFRKFQKSCFEF